MPKPPVPDRATALLTKPNPAVLTSVRPDGQPPVRLLIFTGAFNGLILPVGFGLLLWVAARRHDLMDGYRYPRWLVVVGVVAWVASVYLGYELLTTLGDL